MRRIKVGDQVKAFLNPNIKGKVVLLEESNVKHMMAGGTSTTRKICVVELKDGTQIKVPAAELYHHEH